MLEIGLSSGVREDWFPTSIWYFDLPDHDVVNRHLSAVIQAERVGDPSGMSERSSALGWHSNDDLHLRDDFMPLLSWIESCIAEVTTFQKWDLDKVKPMITNCWANVNDNGASNVVHNHPQSSFSGVYYVQ